MTNLSQDMLRSIEADSFWCMSKLLDGIQVSVPWGSLQGFGLFISLLCWAGSLHHRHTHAHFCSVSVSFVSFSASKQAWTDV